MAGDWCLGSCFRYIWSHFGTTLEVFGWVLETIGLTLGHWTPLGIRGITCGATWLHFGRSWELLGFILESLGFILGGLGFQNVSYERLG